ncbi:cytochrome c oxidase assembly protein COX20, mitochondrial [Macrobrachium rosenbergii]|uniref:cytochrome c oxidase assembly protein COX20, mitochondrial n=1 Tax=Macrobrachium rosenbergii TaxID=79674 RepID=UPI0034D7A93E
MEEVKSTSVFGRDLSKIPCFRNTFLYSISSGIGSGLAYFMLTSKTRQASHVGVGAYCVVTLGYWTYCRYNYSKEKFEMGLVQSALQKQALFDSEEGKKDQYHE